MARDTTASPGARSRSRREFLALTGALGAGLAVPGIAAARTSDVTAEPTITELRNALDAGSLTSRDLVRRCLDRIAAYDKTGPAINALITVDRAALEHAAALDDERATTGTRGPLHGIPIVLKDNLDTADLPTTAGNVLFRDYVPGRDGTVTRLLRQAGAIILGKANMHEWAMGTTTVSSLGGQTRNPYDTARNPGGSSGGTAAAVTAGFAVAGLGTDTLGSIRIPCARTNCVGVRPTAGLVSRAGMIPLSTTQDIPGPITRTVADAALLLDVFTGPDPADPTTLGVGPPNASFVSQLDPNALAGKRLGIVDGFFGDPRDPDCAAANALAAGAIADMTAQGATFVHLGDPGTVTSLAAELTQYEFREALDRYLDDSTTPTPARNLSEIIASHTTAPAVQPQLEAYASLSTDVAPYRAAQSARSALIDYMLRILDDNRLDALLYPSTPTAAQRIDAPPVTTRELQSLAEGRASVTGLPAITVPAGFTGDNLPIGVELLGRPLDDGKLLGMAYAYEQATDHRRPPPLP